MEERFPCKIERKDSTMIPFLSSLFLFFVDKYHIYSQENSKGCIKKITPKSSLPPFFLSLHLHTSAIPSLSNQQLHHPYPSHFILSFTSLTFPSKNSQSPHLYTGLLARTKALVSGFKRTSFQST
jgi:hypothetical protein